MKRLITLLSLITIFTQHTFAQDDSPYKTSVKVDLPIIAAGMGLSYYGLTLMQDKDGLSEVEAANLNKNDVNGFDRFSAGYHSERANTISDYPFYGSFVAVPVLTLLNENMRGKAGQIFGLYVETMAITGALFTMTNGNVVRNRPLTYSPEVDYSEKNSSNAQNSFYAGHTAAAATASFFAAKVFHDFNPDSPMRPFVWAAAATVPAVVGYARLKAGKHFLSDNLLGYGIGAAVGILVPQLHKKSNKTNLSLFPVSGGDYNGAMMTYSF
ncbi:phosphatase PAP2 family protein [Pontibacter arcticus]|uniref:PA-phosphatase n=1 Tax=Pontibacter arcticus TaxID=2080288 RepID=A0A364RI62_9BACT|nr:phosphatase PAP2 family protein [Pontibacter arcticus]RAU83928.1 PA-phosphatase [Pontibacter arcticus]